MIWTLTLNPSVDISYQLDELKIDEVNRTSRVSKTAGGKGLNVTRVLHQAHDKVSATGFLGGSNGVFIADYLTHSNISDEFIHINEPTRNCIAILAEDDQTEILETGPQMKATETKELLTKLQNKISSDDILIISGSVPEGINRGLYAEIIQTISAKTLLDTSQESLKLSLEAPKKPFFIKPNHSEIANLLNLPETKNPEKLKSYLENSLFDGVPIVMISLGSQGALVKYNNEFLLAQIPKIKAVNAVGSGDSTVAGVAHAMNNNESITNIIKTAMTFGILNTLSPKTGDIDMSRFSEFFDQVIISKL